MTASIVSDEVVEDEFEEILTVNEQCPEDISSSSSTELFFDDELNFRAPQSAIDQRRNIAIISHPDSGKTTMTEKLLLYGGAVQQAGAVRQKANQRSTQSDFMQMEQERGISISSTVMNFDYNGYNIRLMDTPGHNDFSEDTYRALAAADNAGRSILLTNVNMGKFRSRHTSNNFRVCGSKPFAPSSNMSALSAAAKARYVSSLKSL